MTQLIPVANKSFLYIWGMQVAYESATTLVVTTGTCRDENNILDMEIDEDITLDTSVVGLNGIDTGTLGASKQYNVWVISDSANFNPTGVILSLATNASPVLPTGYDSYRRIGIQLTDGSSHFIKAYMSGFNNTRSLYFDSAISILPNGSATTPTDVNLGLDQVISGPHLVKLLYTYTPTAAASLCHLSPSGSSGSVVPTIKGSTDDVAISGEIDVMAYIDSEDGVQYVVDSGDTLSLWLLSFTFNV